MPDFPDIVFLGNTLKQWLIAFIFILGGLAAGKICSLLMSGILKTVCKKTKNNIDDLIVASLGRSLTLLILFLGFAMGIRYLSMGSIIRLWAGRILNFLFIIIIARILVRAVDRVIVRYIPQTGTSPLSKSETRIQPLLRKLCSVILWIIAGILALRALGYNVSALMAGLGLGGAALALASKDTLSNFFGSITVFVDRPFRINDRIRIGAYDGTIIEMGIRTSRLRTPENRTVFIPNSLFASQPIENISVQPNIKVVQTISFRADNGSEKINKGIEMLREIAAAVPGLERHSSAGLVSIVNGCQAAFTYYVSKKANYTETVNQVNLEILRRFEEAEIRLV